MDKFLIDELIPFLISVTLFLVSLTFYRRIKPLSFLFLFLAFVITVLVFAFLKPLNSIGSWVGYEFGFVVSNLIFGVVIGVISLGLKIKQFTGLGAIVVILLTAQIIAGVYQEVTFHNIPFILHTFFGWGLKAIPFAFAGFLFIQSLALKQWKYLAYIFYWLGTMFLIIYPYYTRELDRLYTVESNFYITYLFFISQPIGVTLLFSLGTTSLLILPRISPTLDILWQTFQTRREKPKYKKSSAP